MLDKNISEIWQFDSKDDVTGMSRPLGISCTPDECKNNEILACTGHLSIGLLSHTRIYSN